MIDAQVRQTLPLLAVDSRRLLLLLLLFIDAMNVYRIDRTCRPFTANFAVSIA